MQPLTAFARISGDTVQGTVKFLQRRDGVLITAEITGLPQTGFFGFHIHEGKRCGGMKFSETGSHFNPQNTAHPDHAGDLPPLLSAGGKAYLSVLTNRFSLAQVMGRTVVIHSRADDFTTQPAGNSGEKIACGVIGRGQFHIVE